MKSIRILYHMVRADFLERVRRYSFLVTLAAALFLAYAVATEKVWIVVGNGYRGLYNSAWIGMLMTICCSTFLSLAGFYIVKNSVLRDSETRVGRILAATPMRKEFYGLAKTLSNFAVLASMVLVLMVAAVLMQILRAEARPISLWKLWAPFLLIALPSMLLTASIAFLFEILPILRGGAGNVIYFFFWTAELVLGVQTTLDDPGGMQLLYYSTRTALNAADPSNPANFHFSLTIGGERAVRTFVWNGINWNAGVVESRFVWIAVAAGVALLGSLFFHRFDPARERRARRVPEILPLSVPDPEQHATVATSPNLSTSLLSPIARSRSSFGFVRLAHSELRLMLKGQRWWWYAVAIGLVVGQVASPAGVRGGFLVAAWIWPVLMWSQMGSREARHATQPLLFCCERALSRQLPAVWIAGVALALLTGCGAVVRPLLADDWRGMAGWLAGALFIPSLALALGSTSGTGKAFEAIYTVWWYVGPAHQVPGLDFMALTPASNTPALYVILAVSLVVLSYWARRLRMGYI
jgi:hypothetical protein